MKVKVHFMLVVQKATFKAVILLIRYNANVELTDKDGWSPLMRACHGGEVEKA